MGIAPGSYDLIPLTGMNKTVARRMTDSFRDVPHFPLTIDLEIDALLAARTKINAMLESQKIKVSVNDIVIKAVAVALKRVPEANASYTPEEGIAMHHQRGHRHGGGHRRRRRSPRTSAPPRPSAWPRSPPRQRTRPNGPGPAI